MIYKSCSRCGKLHPKGYICRAGTIYSGGSERKLRSTNRWRLKAEEIKERSNYLCAVCKEAGIYTYDDLEVHHITKIKDNEDLLLEDSNLICLCQLHHKEADAGRIDPEKLRLLAKLRDM